MRFAPVLLVALLCSTAALAEETSTATFPSCRNTPGITPPVVQAGGNPADFFPTISQVLGEQGDVLLAFTLTARGKPENLAVEKSSGSVRLDAAALKLAAEWRYKPAEMNGERVACAHKAMVKWTIKPGEGAVSPQRIIIPDAASWPAGAREQGVEGVTAVQADVAPDGGVKTKIVQSSGSRTLDRDAVARVTARPDVKPDMWDGKPVGARFTFYVIWSLTLVTLPAKSAPPLPASHAPAQL